MRSFRQFYVEETRTSIFTFDGQNIYQGSQIVGRGIFQKKEVKGTKTSQLNKNSKVFYGYDVQDSQKLDVYAATKGTVNAIHGKPYDKLFQPMDNEEYRGLVNVAATKFVEQTNFAYDAILYPRSRSDLAKYIAEVVKHKIAAKVANLRAEATIVQEIGKLEIDDESIRKVLDTPKLLEQATKVVLTAIRKKFPEYPHEDLVIMALDESLNNWIDKFAVQNVGKDFSAATHFRNTPNTTPFAQALKMLDKGELDPDLEGCFKGFKGIGGHIDQFVKTYYTVDDTLKQLNAMPRDKPWSKFATRILVIDDNINTGHIYEQLKDIHTQYKECDWFFLMKTELYGV